MNSSRPSDASLYEIAITSEQPSQPLQISPTTFKSMVGLIFDFLSEQNSPATIWLKLPRGEVWQAEINRFRQTARAPYSIYSLQTYYHEEALDENQTTAAKLQGRNLEVQSRAKGNASAEEPPEWDQTELQDITVGEMLGVADKPTELGADSTLNLLDSRLIALPLAADSQLKREYFLLVVSPEFYGLVLAHRPRSMRSSKAESIPDSQSASSKLSQLAEESLERKHPLLGLCSFNQLTLEQVLEKGINPAICLGQPVTKSSAEIGDLLNTWESLVEQGKAATLNPQLLSQLLTRQFQRQEELWRSGVLYRRQAELVPTLQQENGELLNTLQLKDEFVKTMGQELRTPLTTMKTALSLLNSPHIKPPQRQRYMDMLSRECDRQSSLITSVLALVQLESIGETILMEPLRLSEVVPGVVSTYQPLAQEKGVLLAYTVPEDLPAVSSQGQWLKQIVINLLHNSIKFTQTGGQVWVRAKQQGDFIQIEFRDTGIGIASAELPKIFDRFYRVRTSSSEDSSGVGLGLSVVQQLLLRCGGSISVKSKPGEGSAFNVLLPIHH